MPSTMGYHGAEDEVVANNQHVQAEALGSFPSINPFPGISTLLYVELLRVRAMDLYNDIINCNNALFIETLHTVEHVLKDYPISELAFSFNGGKDCTVLLYFLVAALAKKAQNIHRNDGAPGSDPDNGKFSRSQLQWHPSLLCTIYFKSRDEFPELEEFMHHIAEVYEFKLEVISESIRAGLWDLVERQPHIKLIFMGQRRSDPRCGSLSVYQKCDIGWPELVRVNPLLDWSYSDIWSFLKGFNLEYCKLYDHGYTSLGSRTRTVPNPLLHQANGSFQPAFLLNDELKERDGRASPMPKAKIRTAALLIVGDELLTGTTTDLNTPFLCSSLHEIGVTVKKVSLVRDDVDAIAQEAPALARDHDIVISCGGIGPTPDDVTMPGIAEGFRVNLHRDPQLEQAIRAQTDTHHQPYLVMASIPDGSQLHFVAGQPFPIVSFRNIYILPGVPRLVREKFQALRSQLATAPFYEKSYSLYCGEGDILKVLERLQTTFPADELSIGSYPADVDEESSISSGTRQVKVKIVFESKTMATVSKAASMFIDSIDASLIVPEPVSHDP